MWHGYSVNTHVFFHLLSVGERHLSVLVPSDILDGLGLTQSILREVELQDLPEMPEDLTIFHFSSLL